MQRYTVYLSLETALYVLGDISTHHQEHTQLYLQHLALVKPLLLPAAIVEELESSNSSTIVTGSSNGLTSARCCRYSCVCSWWWSYNSSTIAAGCSNGLSSARCCRYNCCAPDDGWRYHPKHVEQFPEIKKLCNIASCWIYTRIWFTLVIFCVKNQKPKKISNSLWAKWRHAICAMYFNTTHKTRIYTPITTVFKSSIIFDAVHKWLSVFTQRNIIHWSINNFHHTFLPTQQPDS